MNRLFGTKFEELNSNVKRQQTTKGAYSIYSTEIFPNLSFNFVFFSKGIWASRDIASPLIILDVEGSDSKERWEERNVFIIIVYSKLLIFSEKMMGF